MRLPAALVICCLATLLEALAVAIADGRYEIAAIRNMAPTDPAR